MPSEQARAVLTSAGIALALAFVASLLWRIPYIYTLIALYGLGFLGCLVTIDDDLPGGWSPHPGGRKAVFLQLSAAAALLAALVLLAVWFPAIRALGGR